MKNVEMAVEGSYAPAGASGTLWLDDACLSVRRIVRANLDTKCGHYLYEMRFFRKVAILPGGDISQ